MKNFDIKECPSLIGGCLVLALPVILLALLWVEAPKMDDLLFKVLLSDLTLVCTLILIDVSIDERS